MTLAHPERFPTLDLGAKGPIGRVTVVCRTARSSADALQARFEAAELAGYARQAPQTQVHLLPSPAQAIGLAARIERLALTAPDVVVVPDAGQPSASTQRLLQAIAKGLPQALLVYAREDGLEGQAAQALGSYHYLLTGDTGPGLVALLGHLAGSGGDPTQLAGLVWRDAQGELHTNPAWHSGSDLPEGPLPAWDLLADSTGSTLAIRTSRACAADCPTCHGAFGRTLRGRRLENVDREVRTLHDRFRPRTIAILDRVFDFDPGRAKALLRGWIGMRLGVTWSFPHGLRGDRIDSELAQLLRQAGVKAVHLPIGSASPRIQQLLGSNLDLAGLERGIQHLADEGIHVTGLFGLGYEREDPRERERSVAFARRCALHQVRFQAVGTRRHGNRWSDRAKAGWSFYTSPERHKAWKQWLADRGETTWQPAFQHWMHEVGCRLHLRQRQS